VMMIKTLLKWLVGF